MIRLGTALAAGAALALGPALASAQERPQRRRQEPIEIRGQVPTPQVVTVRPREVPAYDRRVLVPNFFDRDFWPSILPAYQLVPRRVTSGEGPIDCEPAMQGPPAAREGATPPVTPPVTPPATPPVTPPATEPGTPSVTEPGMPVSPQGGGPAPPADPAVMVPGSAPAGATRPSGAEPRAEPRAVAGTAPALRCGSVTQ